MPSTLKEHIGDDEWAGGPSEVGLGRVLAGGDA